MSDYKCGSCTLYIILLVVFLVTSTVISTFFIYFYWYSKNNITNFIIFIRHVFFNSITNIRYFDSGLLSIDQVLFRKNIDCVIYEIEYFKNFDGGNSRYLIFNNVDAYIEYNPTQNDSETKYLVFASTDKNKEALENYTELWDEVKDQIKTISGDNPIEYGKDFMKARFESNDDLPLGKILNIFVCIIVVESVFQRDNNYYPQVLLHEYMCKHEE